MILFFHMIKTAGMTFSYILRNNFGIYYSLVTPIFNYKDKYNDSVFTNADLEKYLRLNPKLKAISGHYIRPYSIKKKKENDVWLTFVRNPIDRFISGYNFGIMKGNLNCSLEEWIDNPQQKNYQTKFLSETEDIKIVKKIINNNLDFVGLFEKFDLSLILLKNMVLKDLIINYEKKNVTNKKIVKLQDIPERLLRKIKYINQIDIELYEYVKNEVFESYIKNYEGNLKNDYEMFKIQNLNYKFNNININLYRVSHYFYYRPLSWGLSKYFNLDRGKI